MAPIRLTRSERWILSNQYLILEKLDPEHADDFAHTRAAIESGFELEYNPHHIYDAEDVLSEDECREVLEILSMHRALQRSYEALKDKSDLTPRDIQFMGFDGNNETEYMAYARHYCGLDGHGQERFTELHRGDGFNSHMPVLEMYRRMLRVWRDKLEKRHSLTKDEIQEIVAARPYPNA